jgi:hypothetical protein
MKDPHLRAGNDFDPAGLPDDYVVEYHALVDNPREVEQQAHVRLRNKRYKKEWFHASVREAVYAICADLIHIYYEEHLHPNNARRNFGEYQALLLDMTERYPEFENGFPKIDSLRKALPNNLVSYIDGEAFGYGLISLMAHISWHDIREIAFERTNGLIDTAEYEEIWGAELLQVTKRVALSIAFESDRLFVSQKETEDFGEDLIELLARVALREESHLNGKCPSQRIEDPLYRASIAASNGCPIEVQELFATDVDVPVRVALAKNSICDVSILEKLAKDKEINVVEAVARNPASLPSVIQEIWDRWDEDVYDALLDAPSTPPSILAELEWRDFDSKGHRNYASVVFEYLVKEKTFSADAFDRRLAAEHSGCPPCLLERLSSDEEDDVRISVALNENCPPGILITLSTDDPSENVRAAARANPKNPLFVAAQNESSTEQLIELSHHSDPRVRKEVASNSNAIGLEESLVYDSDWQVRNSLLQRNHLPHEIYLKLSSDPETTIRKGVASHENCPPEILDILSKDSNCDMRKIVAEHELSSPETLIRLSKDNIESVREGISMNINSPPEALANLGKDSSDIIRLNVIRHNNCPVKAFIEMANDRNGNIRADIARNPNSPIEALQILANSQFYEYRKLVAANKSCPIELLWHFMSDSNRSVCAIAKRQLDQLL